MKGSQKQPAAAKQKATVNLYNLLSKYKKLILQGSFADDGTTEFTPELHGNIPYNFVVSWNEEVKKYRNLLAQRAGRHSK
ncbi:MAG: hypothetical protein LBS88_11455, partial [Tannerellaceae bacterium]|nr:hypothetical protein [Tannerellaceae bacterium]